MSSILESRHVVILISIIWGFGLALLFRKICNNNNCVVIKVPPSFENSNHVIYDRNNKCYQLEKYSSPCIY